MQTSSAGQLYREVHKHAYLRHISSQHGKKWSGEQYWVVFCVHCDTVPYLEFYASQASSSAHQPLWRVCLSGTSSVSGALVPHQRLYRLTLLTRENAVTLGAHSWEEMKDWLDTLRVKLREMKILGPAENLYSKPPEQLMRNRAPTRDPTSPLPPPPPGPTIRVPGTEVPTRPQQGEEGEGGSVRIQDGSVRSLENCGRSQENSGRSQENSGRSLESSGRSLESGGRGQEISERVQENSGRGQENSNDVNVVTTASTRNSDPEQNQVTVSRNGNTTTQESVEDIRARDTNSQTVVTSSSSSSSSSQGSKENVSKIKVCKDGGFILYNDSLEGEGRSSAQQWEELTTSLPDILPPPASITGKEERVGPTTSRVAHISGMSVCLVDSLIPPHTSNTSDDDFTADSQEDSLNITEIKDVHIKRDSKGYTHVDVNKKRGEGFKNKIAVEGKPTPLPRTKLQVVEKEDQLGGVYMSLRECYTEDQPHQVILREPPDRKRVTLNRTSSVPDSIESENILHNFCGEMVEATSPGSTTLEGSSPPAQDSNITIIAVSTQQPQPSTAIPVLGEQFPFDTPSQPENKKYVNVSITSMNQEDEEERVEVRHKTSNGGYGHIRHSTSTTTNPANNNNNRQFGVMEIPKFNFVKNIEVKKTLPSSTHTKDFYESIFGPINNQQPSGQNSNVGDSNVVVQVPKLVVNIPTSPLINEDRENVSIVDTSQVVMGNGVVETAQNSVERSDSGVRENEYEFLVGGSGSNQGQDGGGGKRAGLFTRGLTDLNIMTRFKNFSVNSNKNTNQNNNTPTSKTSNFYTEESSGGTPNTSSVSEGGKRRWGLLSKLGEGRGGGGGGGSRNRNLENVQRSESSLRRNWSEHNDRTAPPQINRNLKPLRPRPPLLNNRPTNVQSSEADSRRRSNSLNSNRLPEENNTSQNVPVAIPKPTITVSIMSLREQQVMRLRNEMGHSGGIRLLLSSRDSPDQAVALVDIFSGVWVAGWKQRSHPLLYNALHIGDRLHSVDGSLVSSARQARRAIQNNTGPKVEIIIKRLPNGRVYVLKRDTDRQDLGLLLDGSNITGIVPNSPAHRAGVPSSGTLTEVNGRPLSLVLKKGSTQVRDRLGSVGRDVSILVQPVEFVSLLRTALKAVRGHKEYVVQ